MRLPSINAQGGKGAVEVGVGLYRVTRPDGHEIFLLTVNGFEWTGNPEGEVIPGRPIGVCVPCEGVHLQRIVDEIREKVAPFGVTIL